MERTSIAGNSYHRAYPKPVLYPTGATARRRPTLAVGLGFLIADGDVVRTGTGPFVPKAEFEDVPFL